jgi:hypothetical protein
MLGALETRNEVEIHHLLSNERRQYVIEELNEAVGAVTLRRLAEAIAVAEAGQDPPRSRVRSVYNSLHQTHLPKLDDYGVVEYNEDRKTVRLDDRAREVNLYMEVVTPYGITWAQYYQWLSFLSLLVLLAAQLKLSFFSRADPVLATSGFLIILAGSVAYQLWSRRWFYFNRLVTPEE